jgi:hypothetical protein
LGFFHYDLYAQALAKIERGHALDVSDVREMFHRGLIKPEQLTKLFEEIMPQMYRYPAIDPRAFKQAMEETVARFQSRQDE